MSEDQIRSRGFVPALPALWNHLFLVILLAACGTLQAQTSWKGTTSTDWNNAANWTAGVPSASVDAIIGDTNFTGINQPALSGGSSCNSLTIGTGTKASTLTVGKALTVAGNIVIGDNGTITHTANTAISLSGNWTNSGVYTASGQISAVTFAGSAQSLSGATTFKKLTIKASSTLTLNANISVAKALTVSGVLNPNESPTYQVSGAGTFTVNSAGTILVKASTYAGNYNQSGGTSLNAASVVNYAATNSNQTIASALTYGILIISGGTTKMLGGNLSALNSSTATAGNILVQTGTLDLSTFTANRGTTVAGGTFSVADGATLRIGGSNGFPGNYATHSIGAFSTVEFYGSSQTISAEAYGNLILSGSSAATKTGAASAMNVYGNLTLATNANGASVSFTPGANVTVSGNVVIGAGTTFNGSSFSHSFAGNWTNSGTFTGSTSAATFTGANANIAGTGANNFNDLTVSGISTVASNTSLTVLGNLSTGSSGTFTHTAGGTGILTMSGAGKSISGVGITLSGLTVSGSISTTSSLTVAGNVAVSGTLNASGGTITLSGAGKTISGSGTIGLNALAVTGSISTTNSFSMASDISVSGSFSATAGTATFSGTSILSGTANLFNVTLNGTQLQLGSSAVLGVAGSLSLAAGTFDVSTTTPNTVNFNSSGAQSITSTTYHHLSVSGAGTKTAAGPLMVEGDLTIGGGVTLNASSFTHSVNGNWVNNGTFSAGTSTVQFMGGSDASISGATTFNIFTLNKNSPNNLLNLSNNVTAATVDMTSGELHTGTSTLTMTSTRSGNGIILGTITRTHAFALNTPYAFESPNNTITFTLGTVTSVTVKVGTGVVSDFPFGGCINRQYTNIVTTAGAYAGTLRLHYQDSELNGNSESTIQLWRYNGSWAPSGKTSNDAVNNWVEQIALTDITNRWTMSDDVNAVQWNGLVSSAWENPSNWTVVQGAPSRPPSTNDIVDLGTTNFANQPSITSAVSIKGLNFGSSNAVTLTLGPGGSLTMDGNISGTWSTNAEHTINVGAQSLSVGGNLNLSDGANHHVIHLNASTGSIVVTGSLIEAGGANITFSGNGTLSVGGDFSYSSGTFTPATGTVTYNGPNSQIVAGLSYYALAFNKPSGAATLSSAATVNNNLTLSTGGSLALNAPLTVVSNVVINSGTTLNAGSSSISAGGNWTRSGTFNPGTSTVIFNGSGAQSIGGSIFNNVTISTASGSSALAGNLVLNGDLNVSSGSLDLGTFSVNRSAVGGTFTLGANTTLMVGGSSFPANFGTRNLSSSSVVQYNGTGLQTVSAEAYGHVWFSNGGTNAKTLAGATTVGGNLIINSGATLSGGTANLMLQGNWTNAGMFSASTGTVILGGTNKNVSGNTTFNNLNVPGSYTVDGSDFEVAGNVAVSGNFNGGSGTATIDGDLLNSGTLFSSGTTTFTGTRTQTLSLLNAIQSTSSGVVNFNGSIAPVLNSTASPQFANVNINNTAGITASLGWTVFRTFTVGAGARFNGGTFTHTFVGDFTCNGTVTSSGILLFAPAAAHTISGGGVSSSGAVIFGGSGAISLALATTNFNSVVIQNTHVSGIAASANWNLSGDLSIGSGATFNGGTRNLTLAGNWINNGSFNAQSSTIIINGAASEISGSASTTFNNLTIAGNVTALDDFALAGNFTNNGVFDAGGFVASFIGGSSSIIAGTTTPTAFDTLLIAKSSATTTLGINLNNLTTLTVSSGTLNCGIYSISTNGIAGTFTVGAGAVFKIGGANPLPSFSSYLFDPVSTIEYSGTGSQTIAAMNFGNLTSSSTGPRTLASNGVVGIAGAFTPGGNTYSISGSTVNFNGSGAQTIPAFNFNHLASSSTGARTLASGTVGIAGTFSPGSNSYTITNNTIEFNGTTQTIPAFIYNNLTVKGSGTKTLGANITVAKGLALLSGTLDDGGFVATVNGDVSNAAAHVGAGKILLSSGSAIHSLSGTGSFQNLELSDDVGAVLTLTNLTVNGRLGLTVGSVTTTTNILMVNTNATVTRGSGYVIGNLQKGINIGTNVSQTFEVGTTNGYNPVSLTFSNVTVPGFLVAKAVSGNHPSISSADLNPNADINVYWSLSRDSALSFNAFNALFQFNNPGDIDSEVNPLFLKVGKFDGSAWSYPRMATQTSTNFQVLSVFGMGDFAAALPANTAPTLDSISNVTINEDAPVQTINLTGITGGPLYEIGQMLSIVAYSSNTNLIPDPDVTYTSPSTNGSLALAPIANANGTATVTVVVTDGARGGVSSTTNSFTVTVNAVNDRPTLDAISNITVNEDPLLQIIPLTGISAGPANESGQSLSVTAHSSDPTMITDLSVDYVSPDSTAILRVTPAPDTIGVATITVVVTDNEGTAFGGINAVTNSFTITINAVNHVPSFDLGPNVFVTTNALSRTITNWAAHISPGQPANEAGQALDFIVAVDEPDLFSVQPAISADGTLTFTPSGLAGFAIVMIQLHDNGGTANGGVDVSETEFFAIGLGVGGFTPATGGEAISADDALTHTNWTTLSGPNYFEGGSGDIEVGTIILQCPEGFEFDTNVVVGNETGVLIAELASSGPESANINGVTNGTIIPVQITPTTATLTITSASTNGAIDYLELRNLRVRPTGTNLISGDLIDTGSNRTNVSFGFLREVPGAPKKLEFQVQPSQIATAGVAFAQAPVVAIEDQFGHIITGAQANLITLTRDPVIGGGVLLGSTTNAVINGIADYAGQNLRFNICATNRLVAVSPGLLSAVSDYVTTLPAAAAELRILVQPSLTATAGVVFASQPVLEVVDRFGNHVDSATDVTATRGMGSGDLQGATTVPAIHGLVTFTNLSHQVATNITINFNSDGLTGVTSEQITVSAASLGQLVFIRQPGLARAGKIFATQPIVRAVDSFGNVAAVPAHLDVTMSLSSGIGLMFGQKTFDIGTAAGNGTVTFTNLEINTAGNKQLTASAIGFTDAVSDVFTNVGTPQRYFLQGEYPVGAGPGRISLANFRGKDTFRDMAVANYSNNTVSVRLCNDAGGFGELTLLNAGLHPVALQTADFNRDKFEDIAVANYGTNTVTVLLNARDGTFAAAKTFTIGTTPNPGPVAMIAADVNRDGKPDLVVVNGLEKSVTMLANSGSGGFSLLTNYPLGLSVSSVQVVDLNGDHLPDVILANPEEGTVTYLPGTTNGTLGPPRTLELFPAGNPEPRLVIVADFNHDAVPDLVTVNYASNNISVFIAHGNATFTHTADYAVGTKPCALLFRDLDADGKSDFAVVNSGSGTVDVLLNRGDGYFDSGGTIPVNADPTAIAGSNFNEDGVTDLAVVNTEAEVVSDLLYSAPIARSQAVSVTEDAGAPVTLSSYSLFPTTVNYLIVNSPTNGTLTGTPPNLFYTPNTNYVGMDTFTFSVISEAITSAVATVRLVVNPVNDAPGFDLTTNVLFTFEDAGLQTISDLITNITKGPADEGGQAVSFVVTTANARFFSLPPKITAAGVLTFKTARDVSGTNIITIVARDNGGTSRGGISQSAPQTVAIVVLPVNDPAKFGAITAKTIREDSSTNFTFVVADIDTMASELTVRALSSNPDLVLDEDLIVQRAGTNWNLSITPRPNAFGRATITLIVNDGGADVTTAFPLIVQPVNDAPSFALSTEMVSVVEDSLLQTFPDFATSISAGPLNESSQTMSFIVTTTNAAVFLNQPVISPKGALSFRPQANLTGTNWVTVRLRDNGGVALGGTNQSPAQMFAIVVVHDPVKVINGSYNGLFYETSAVSHQSSGFLSFVIGTRRAFSGKMLIEGGAYSFTGQFDTNGAAFLQIPRTGKSTLTTQLRLDVENRTGEVNGTVSNESWSASVQGNRVATNLLNVQAGKYSMVLAGTGDGSASPGGDGIGVVTLATNGDLSFSGTLSDNAAAAQATKICSNGQWPLYIPLYGGRGSVLGWVNFSNQPTSQCSGMISWVKTNSVGSFYPTGYTNELFAIGSPLSLTATPLLDLTNGIVVLGGANLVQPITNSFLFGSNSVVTMTSTNARTSLTLNKTTGYISGSFLNPINRLVTPIKGILLQGENTARGFFYTPNQSGSFWLGPE